VPCDLTGVNQGVDVDNEERGGEGGMTQVNLGLFFLQLLLQLPCHQLLLL